MKRSLAALAAFVMSATAAHAAEPLHAYFGTSDDPARAWITISPCSADEVAECEWHALSCERPSGSLEFSVIVGPVEHIAASLIMGTEGQAKGTLRLAGSTVPLNISSVHVDTNELDGGWLLTIGAFDVSDLWSAITPENANGAAIELAGKSFVLAPEPGDGAKLVQLRDACRGY